jgi:hypothetical protein
MNSNTKNIIRYVQNFCLKFFFKDNLMIWTKLTMSMIIDRMKYPRMIHEVRLPI